MMKTVRQRILEFIQSHRAVSAAELSQTFRMTEANARHHLSILMQQGSIQVIDRKASTRRGRPARHFAISNQMLGDNLDILSSALLDVVSNNPQFDPDGDTYKEIARRMAVKMTAPSDSTHELGPLSRNFTRRLNRLTQILNQSSYDARWEAHAGAPHLILNRCPYAAILSDHPELCKVDAYLIQEILESPVEQTAKLVKDSQGLQHCIFHIGLERV